MLFHKKPKDSREVPLEDVQKMTKKGMSDKDIIRQLKSKGYSYEAIEGAMLRAVKEGVDDEKPRAMDRMETESPAVDNVFDMPREFAPDFTQQTQQMPDEEVEAPEMMLEELIEGIVDDKWRKFDDRLNKIDDNFDRIRAEIKQFEIRIDQNKKDSPSREIEARMADISEQLEDMEARVGGLEKAFKQFLPSLTKNIEALSHIIHEMKERHNLVEREL